MSQPISNNLLAHLQQGGFNGRAYVEEDGEEGRRYQVIAKLRGDITRQVVVAEFARPGPAYKFRDKLRLWWSVAFPAPFSLAARANWRGAK